MFAGWWSTVATNKWVKDVAVFVVKCCEVWLRLADDSAGGEPFPFPALPPVQLIPSDSQRCHGSGPPARSSLRCCEQSTVWWTFGQLQRRLLRRRWGRWLWDEFVWGLDVTPCVAACWDAPSLTCLNNRHRNMAQQPFPTNNEDLWTHQCDSADRKLHPLVKTWAEHLVRFVWLEGYQLSSHCQPDINYC